MNEENEVMQESQQELYVPSPKWKRVAAWIMFGIVSVGIILWLLGIAFPTWPDAVKEWLR